ncbi:hypothetical protein OO256_25650 [Pseudomonas sp. DCB_CB]|uniref:hypothetical protein n=1 Tax=Pseudomonas TaxID=286 RepID=UPI0012FE0DA7|nr:MULTISPECIES: hypothetical protein [Pseudomonas]MCX2694337.1 hypothetical protein [Pseudomonas sp. DCB_BZ]MCX2859468.1 hypothetical protein [Pseudomonas sp. DCB_CB]
MSVDKYPYFVSAEESEELCISSGWYIGQGDSFSLPEDMVVPFESESLAKEYIES